MNNRIHVVGLLALTAALLTIPVFVTNDFYLKIVFMIGVYYLAAAGLNVLVGWAGQKSLGHAGLFAVGAYAAALLTAKAGWNPWLALMAAAILGGLFGIVIALPSLRVKGPSLAMVTIGFGVVVEKIIEEWQDVFAGQQGIYGVLPPNLGGSAFTNKEWVWFVVLLAVATHLSLRALLKGKYGRAFLAVQTSEVAAESVGVSVYRFKVLAFVISAVTCAVAGALVAQQNQYINSDFITFGLSIFFLLMVLFGGASVYGPLLGAIVLTLMDAFLARWPHVQHFTYGALLLFALYAMPKGLAGALKSIGRRLWPALYRPEPLPAVVGDWQLARDEVLHEEQALLEAKDLYKAYGGVVPTNNVDFKIKTGHVHSLIGPNGAGKTTLLNILSGIVAPDHGTILFNGTDITALKASEVCKLGIGRTFQNLNLFADMSVLDNVLVGRHPHLDVGFWSCLFGLSRAAHEEREARAEALRILDFLGLRHKANETAGSLPYGSQRRLEIARALATHPKLLLLDEPAAGLNPQETREFTEVIAKIRDKGITVLLIEHHMDLVMAISDHVIVLDYGETIAEGRPEEVQRNPRVIAAYLGTEDKDQAQVTTEDDRQKSRQRSRISSDTLRIDELKVSYGAIEALSGISLEVKAGEVVTIIGGNGAGKTTLMKAISGIEPAASGRIFFEGQDITRMPGYLRVPLGISQSPEGRQVFADHTVHDNLVLGAYHRKVSDAQLAAEIDACFESFPQLRERRDQMAGTMSGGEQQMLAIARALMASPKLLLLDEPSLGLAPLIVSEIFKVIRGLKERGVTILLVEQMANQALAIADRAYVLETGSITLSGSARALLSDPKVREAYLGSKE
jgi:branched-chain amino acid transport system permease protein